MLKPIQPFFTNSQEVYISRLNKTEGLIYWIILLIIIATISALPLVHFDISVKSAGIIRPSLERTEIKSMIPGIIDSIFFTEGDLVEKDCVMSDWLIPFCFLKVFILFPYMLKFATILKVVKIIHKRF